MVIIMDLYLILNLEIYVNKILPNSLNLISQLLHLNFRRIYFAMLSWRKQIIKFHSKMNIIKYGIKHK